jgi:hypothetical protein
MSGRELRLFDARAVPPSWTARMSAPEHAVLHLDPHSGVVVARGGERVDPATATALVFPDREAACRYAEQRVDETPAVDCDVYDHRGKSAAPLKVTCRASRARERRSQRTWIAVALTLLVVGGVTCAYDLAAWGRRPWLTVVGLKLVISGLLLLAFNRRHLVAAWRRTP